jgi:hypothetical protein
MFLLDVIRVIGVSNMKVTCSYASLVLPVKACQSATLWYL